MTVLTRSMAKASNCAANEAAKAARKVASKPAAKAANEAVTEATTLTPLRDAFVYRDDATGIEYITEEHIQMRGISNKFYDLRKIEVVGIYLYDKITEIHPRYIESIPKEVADRKDLFAIAPEGYLWVEDDRGTSYFHWDEWMSLIPHSYKRGTEFNFYYSRFH